ncbi:hypothetical protein ACP70R_030914 [Stipagrostis hirtigluma subsp. patula]
MSSVGKVPTTAAAAAASEPMSWGTSPPLYLSYGMVSLKGRRPALTDAVVAAPSFTALSPPMGLDYFAVFDGHSGAAVADYLRARLGAAIAEQIDGELRSATPRFSVLSHDVSAWWRTAIQGAFRAVDEEVVGVGAAGDAATVGATALVALVLEQYVVLANCGVSRAVISRGAEEMQLTSEHRPNRPDEKQSMDTAGGGHVVESTCKVGNVLKTTRAFGSSQYRPEVTAEPEVAVVERTPRDDFLILASDGLWDAVSPAAACAFVRRRLLKRSRITMPWEAPLDGRGSPTVVAKELAEHAVGMGSQDNVSVVLILFREFWACQAKK